MNAEVVAIRAILDKGIVEIKIVTRRCHIADLG